MPMVMNSRFINPETEERLALDLSEEVPELNEDGGCGSSILQFYTSDSFHSIEQQRQHLPVFIKRSQFLYLLENSRVIVVTGETGSGKSTQLPQYVYEAGWLDPKSINFNPFGITMAVTQPRRVAALTLSTRVAEEKNWQIGKQVGYIIRFEECWTPNFTVISYLTEGMMIQELLRDPLLTRFRVIMLDEVHERSLQTDILLGLIKKVLRKRPYDLRIIISSATLEAGKFIEYFSEIGVPEVETDKQILKLTPVSHLNVEGRQYPVSIFYSLDPVPCYLSAAKETVFRIHETKPLGGDILVFVTGQNEVSQLVGNIVDEYRNRKERFINTQQQQNSKSKLPATYHPLRCLQLHGSLPQHEQLRVFERPTRTCRKVIVATNIAEASVTLPGISYVIDCGFSRIRAYNPVNGLEALVTIPTSQASARQRAGRAGRTRTGQAYRLYTEEAYNKLLPRFTLPESLRVDLSGALLRLKTLGINRLAQFDWLDPPPASHVGQSAERLVALGALDANSGHLTIPRGVKLAEVSTTCGLDQPSAAAALLGACDEGCSQEIAAIVSLMQIQRIFTVSDYKRAGDRIRRQVFGCRQGDHLTELNAFVAYEHQSKLLSKSELRTWCRDVGLNERGLAHAVILRDRIGSMFHRLKLPWVKAEPEGNPNPVLRALAARLASSGSHYLTIRGDHQLRLHPNCILYSSTTRWPTYILFTNIFLTPNFDDNSQNKIGKLNINDKNDLSSTCISGISVIQPDWLLELAPHYYQFGTDREHLEYSLRGNK
ncbi:putative ATP-dependent RNA helicase DHX35 [Schistosoma japonicum]|nr:putative ATP-dependent RNA helicase DHX35 [Schistosoma japonicum]KAH8854073.1 putative ATP-dependent RNA helicase DHX35 [Schistosoma japonicum]